ncbi:MAG: hypothetical protein R3E42_11865 [Burkholderiaceae bacterium]
MRQPGQVVTHRQLLLDVWGEEFTSHTHYLRLYMGAAQGRSWRPARQIPAAC